MMTKTYIIVKLNFLTLTNNYENLTNYFYINIINKTINNIACTYCTRLQLLVIKHVAVRSHLWLFHSW